ncbi:MAG: hypothetical protein ACXWNQ_05340 [Anaerolineales bacterium]
MKQISFRIWIGAGLVLLGMLMLLERFGLFRGITNYFWGLLFLAGGAYFLYRFANNMRGEWWAVIPGSALIGLGLQSFVPGVLGDWSGFLFLGALGLGFFAVYFTDRERWWAIIPGGVLVTLGLTSALGDVFGVSETGGFFFLGLGLTFLLVAVLASLQWAWIPGVVLLVLGAVIGTPFVGSLNYVWPAALILGGLLLIFQFARKH